MRSNSAVSASSLVSLVSCLPALERCQSVLDKSLYSDNLCCLLEALAWCPSLTMLALLMFEKVDVPLQLFPDALKFAKLRNLTRLVLCFGNIKLNHNILAGVVGALAPLKGLAELNIGVYTAFCSPKYIVVPAALGQLKALRALSLGDFAPCDLEAGCLGLPKLERLVFQGCDVRGAKVLPGAAALQRLTNIEFSGGKGPHFFDHQLVHLPLQRMVFQSCYPGWDARGGPLPRLPADMGSLSSTLLHIDFTGHGFKQFPLGITQLTAL